MTVGRIDDPIAVGITKEQSHGRRGRAEGVALVVHDIIGGHVDVVPLHACGTPTGFTVTVLPSRCPGRCHRWTLAPPTEAMALLNVIAIVSLWFGKVERSSTPDGPVSGRSIAKPPRPRGRAHQRELRPTDIGCSFDHT